MGLIADARAMLIQKTAPHTVRYGKPLSFTGSEVADPDSVLIPTRHGKVRCDLYRPRQDSDPPIYTHFHGGGFLMRYPEMDDFFARFVVRYSGAAVVNVDYDVAPQRRYPVAQEQAHDVVAWLGDHGAQWGLDAGRIAVGGFSAGGNLAASACLQARDNDSVRPVLQLLGVPSLDVGGDISDKHVDRARPMISNNVLRLIRATYFRDVARRTEPYASPLRAENLTGLPPTVVVTAEYDRLRAEGDAYADRLRDAGVDVVHHVVPGRDHYFLNGSQAHAREMLDLLAGSLAEAFARVP